MEKKQMGEQKEAVVKICRVGEKLIGLASLFRCRGTTDDVVFEASEAEGIANLLQDFGDEIGEAGDILRSKEVTT